MSRLGVRRQCRRVFVVGSLAAAVVVGTVLVGCSPEAKTPATAEKHDEHAHPEKGPHNGALIELGREEYHAELIHDDAAHKVTIYLLDWAAVKPVAIADGELTLNLVVEGKPQQYKLPAVPQADDAAGQSSRFELIDESLCTALDAPKTTGRLNVTIAGKSFAGEVRHDHDHDHGHKH